MPGRQRYKKKADAAVSAVQLNLETEGFSYEKWGATQRCKAGDWLVWNDGDTYTIDQDVFARTYQEVGPAQFVKVTVVWAEVATEDGAVGTKEGATHYVAGDYLVYNEEDGGDAYAVTAEKFEAMYESAE